MTFFSIDQFDFPRALRKYYKDPVLLKVFCSSGKFFKNRQKGHFLENVDQKSRFLTRVFPSKLVILTPKNAFRKILRLVSQNGCRKVIPIKENLLEKFGDKSRGEGKLFPLLNHQEP